MPPRSRPAAAAAKSGGPAARAQDATRTPAPKAEGGSTLAIVAALAIALGGLLCWRLTAVAPDSGLTWAKAGAIVPGRLMANSTCKRRPAPGLCGAPRRENRCARAVIDNAVPEKEARILQDMVQWAIDEAWGGGAGPPSVIDLHQGSISYKTQFVEMAALFEFKQVAFSEAQKEAYHKVRTALRGVLADTFGVPEEALLHDMTFFSHINGSKEAQTVHDEYWHQHVDTEQYGTFEYTTLLYLSTQNEDFTGGEFLFENTTGVEGTKEDAVAVVEPRFNRLIVFTSDEENPHRVEKVKTGVRIALTAAFTCIKEKAAEIGPAFPPKRPEEEESST